MKWTGGIVPWGIVLWYYTSGIVPWGKYSISRNSDDNVDDEETAVKCIGGGGTNIVFHFNTFTLSLHLFLLTSKF